MLPHIIHFPWIYTRTTPPEDTIHHHYKLYMSFAPKNASTDTYVSPSNNIQQIKRKWLRLFLPWWLSCEKKTPDSILQNNLGALFLQTWIWCQFKKVLKWKQNWKMCIYDFTSNAGWIYFDTQHILSLKLKCM